MVYYKSVSAIAGGGKTAVLLNTFSKGLARCSGSNWVFFPDPNWLCAPGANSVPAFAVDTATTEQTEPVVFKSNTLPDWFPEDAPAPDPHGEIVTVYWYVDENGNTVTYNPAERKTATGNAGTATIYWVDAHMVTWGITSNAGGAMVFTGTVSTNRGQIFVLGDIEFDGDCGGTIDNVTTLKGKNTATLSGFMIDSRGISITAPDVSSNYYR